MSILRRLMTWLNGPVVVDGAGVATRARRAEGLAAIGAVIAIVALFYGFSSSQTPCALAQAGSCPVGDDETFAGNIAWESDTAFAVTFDHAATAARTVTFQDAAGTVVLRDTTDTLTNKTLTSPVLTTSPTAAGATWVDLGTVPDVFLESGGVLNWDAGDVTVTHSANTLAFAGASTGYTFDSQVAITRAATLPLTVTNTQDLGGVEVFRFQGDRATPAANDYGRGLFTLSDPAGTQKDMFRLDWRCAPTSDTACDEGQLLIHMRINNTFNEILDIHMDSPSLDSVTMWNDDNVTMSYGWSTGGNDPQMWIARTGNSAVGQMDINNIGSDLPDALWEVRADNATNDATILNVRQDGTGDALLGFVFGNVVSAASSTVVGMDQSDSLNFKFCTDSLMSTATGNCHVVFERDGDAVFTKQSSATALYTFANPGLAATSHSEVLIQTGGGASGDAFIVWDPQDAITWHAGVDQSSNDDFVMGAGTTVGTNSFLAVSGLVTTATVRAIQFSPPGTVTLAAAPTATYGLIDVSGRTINYTGTSTVTSHLSWVRINPPTFANAAGTVTHNTASTVLITGAPIEGSGDVLGVASALRIQNSSSGTPTIQAGVTIEALTAGTSDYGVYFAGNPQTAHIAGVGDVVIRLDADNNDASNFEIRNGAGANILLISETVGSSRLPDGVQIGTGSSNYLLDDASNGAGSATLYIGNASINVTPSDIRLKANITNPAIDAPAWLTTAAMYLREFDWIGEDMPHSGYRSLGVVAQEIDDFAPQLVIKPRDGVSMWGFDYGMLAPYLLMGWAEHDDEIRTLQVKIATLEERIGVLETN